MHSTVLVAGFGVLSVIAYGDVCLRRIPNGLCLLIAALGLVRIASTGDALAASYTLFAAAGTFAITFLLFWRGTIGGGDAKLVTAMTLLIGHQNLLAFFFLTSLCGGVLGLAALARDKLGPRLARLRFASNGRLLREGVPPAPVISTVPYGLAIAVAGVITLITAK
jgi:prepilin peptidase CpaA